MIKSFIFSYTFLFLFFFACNSSGLLNVSGLFSDNMVLQQNANLSLCGWTNPGDTIAVSGSWNNINVKVVTDAQNKWEATLQTPKAKTDGTTYAITIKGKTTITLNDILIGEVWLLSGKSNMEMPLSGWTDAPVEGSAQAISTANFPNIRLIKIISNRDINIGKPKLKYTETDIAKNEEI